MSTTSTTTCQFSEYDRYDGYDNAAAEIRNAAIKAAETLEQTLLAVQRWDETMSPRTDLDPAEVLREIGEAVARERLPEPETVGEGEITF